MGDLMHSQLKEVKTWLLRRLAVRSNVDFHPSLHVGPGSVIWAPSKLSIGRDVYIGKHVTIEVDGLIGDEVLIANGVGIVGKRDHDFGTVGKGVRSAPWVGDDRRLSLRTSIGSDVWLGFNCVVYSGLTIGNSSIVAAGSVVTASVPENSIVAGVPAKVIRQRFTNEEFEDHWRVLLVQGVRRFRMPDDLTFGNSGERA
jgi:acetyltransferase-like isoleucine patch superfamily enzyme